MRVWLLQRNEPTPHDNKGEQRIFRTGIMARMLAEAGHNVVWWTSDFDHYGRRNRYGSSHRVPVDELYEVQFLKSRGYNKNISLRRYMANKDVARSFSKVAYDDELSPDLIIASIPTAELAWEGIKYARSRKIPVILDVRDLWPDHFATLAPRWASPLVNIFLVPLRIFNRKVFCNADGIFALTEPFLEWGLAYAKRRRSYPDRVVPMGYVVSTDIDNLALAEAKGYWNQQGVSKINKELIVSFVGAIGKNSDFDVLMAAASVLAKKGEPVKFVICGDGDELSRIRSRAKNISNVILPGWINKAQIKVLLKRSDIGLLPYKNSENYIKNLPNKPAEYLSENLALASSLPDGPLQLLIDEFNCGFSYLNSADILSKKLSECIHSPDKLLLYRSNASCAFEQKLNGDVVYREMIQYLENYVINCSAAR